MPPRLASLTPHLPAALLLLFSGWSGTFFEGAGGGWALAGHLALLAFVGVFGRLWPDPLRLGRGGRLLLLALGASAMASFWASPVPRAGRLGILLLPAFLMVPSAVAACWSSAEARRLGLHSLSLVVTGVAIWSLAGWWHLETPGASFPLGHHNLLASWLLALLPLAAMPWRDGGAWRAVAAVAGLTGLASLLATRSLGAVAAAGVVAAAVAARSRRGRWGLLVAALLLAPQAPRISGILSGSDLSAVARWEYLAAGWRGLTERPALGWGPGAARWTLAEHLRPIPGVHPPDQVVADVHSLPLQLGYELGWSGLLLACGVALAFLRRRSEVADPGLRRAALLGLAAVALIGCASRPLAAPAVPLAAMIAAGAMLAAERRPRERSWRGVTALTAALLAALVLPLDLAHVAYDRAVAAGGGDEQQRHLRRAAELDPDFPLYAARLARLETEIRPADPEAARRALAAAESGRGVAGLWLSAGILGQDAGEAWSREALTRACSLSPLGAIAPFRLTLGEDPEAKRGEWAARALLAEPLLMAAVAWRDHGPLLDAAAAALEGTGGVDAGWLGWLEENLHARPAAGRTRRLGLEMDGDVATSASLYAFRRRPWPAVLAEVEIYEAVLERVEPGTAATLGRAAPDVFQGEACGLGG